MKNKDSMISLLLGIVITDNFNSFHQRQEICIVQGAQEKNQKPKQNTGS
jgi:hypothetical protein